MAKIDKKRKIGTAAQSAPKTIWEFPLEKNDMMWLGIGLAVILVGYLLMYTGVTDEPAVTNGTWNNPMAVVVAPIVLVIGYCVIIPMAILKMFRKKSVSAGETNE